MVALFAVLAWAVIRPRGWPEAVAAVPAAVIVVAVGAIPARTALTQARSLGPAIGFLAAILVLAHLCDDGAVLAVLLGVNIGPNLTYTGSLATLLWRRILHHHGTAPDLREFTRLGLLTVPAGLVLAVVTLWAGLRVIGG